MTGTEAWETSKDERTCNPTTEEASGDAHDTIANQDKGLKPSGGVQTGLSEERDQAGTDRPQPPIDTARPR